MPAIKEVTEVIPGTVGDIEVRYHDGQDDKPIVVICHPHPLHGGTMDNKVVHTLFKTFAELGLSTLRFNFRGVGKSAGEYDEGRGESEDLKLVCDWFREKHPGQPLWLAGFSFGSYVALRAHQQVNAEQLCLVAPPVSLYDFTELPDVKIPWMVVQGGQDEVVDPDAVTGWLESRSPRPYVVRFKEAGHFFHGGLIQLKTAISKAAQRALS
jgi:alpha/beta superfamily hydrolase